MAELQLVLEKKSRCPFSIVLWISVNAVLKMTSHLIANAPAYNLYSIKFYVTQQDGYDNTQYAIFLYHATIQGGAWAKRID